MIWRTGKHTVSVLSQSTSTARASHQSPRLSSRRQTFMVSRFSLIKNAVLARHNKSFEIKVTLMGDGRESCNMWKIYTVLFQRENNPGVKPSLSLTTASLSGEISLRSYYYTSNASLINFLSPGIFFRPHSKHWYV